MATGSTWRSPGLRGAYRLENTPRTDAGDTVFLDDEDERVVLESALCNTFDEETGRGVVVGHTRRAVHHASEAAKSHVEHHSTEE